MAAGETYSISIQRVTGRNATCEEFSDNRPTLKITCEAGGQLSLGFTELQEFSVYNISVSGIQRVMNLTINTLSAGRSIIF